MSNHTHRSFRGYTRNPDSIHSVEEMFQAIVKHIRDNGCKVEVKKNAEKVNGSNGYFTSEPYPHIKVALKGRPWPKTIQLIVHEYCHYWQWKDGFLDHKDDDGNIIYSHILEGDPVTAKQRDKASKLVRISEYDCEIRTGSLFAPEPKGWNLESIFSQAEHIKSANTYNRHIVWSIGDKENEGSGIFLHTYDKLAPKLWGNKKFTNFWDPWTDEGMDKILAPISAKHKKIFDDALAETIGKALKGNSVERAAKKLDIPMQRLDMYLQKKKGRVIRLFPETEKKIAARLRKL